MAYVMMKGSDYPRYGSLVRGIGAQFSLGVDQYPKDLIAATDAMSNYYLDRKTTARSIGVKSCRNTKF